MVPLPHLKLVFLYCYYFGISAFFKPTCRFGGNFSVEQWFSLITLPGNGCQRRAKLAMAQAGPLPSKDAHNAGKVLDAAFLTYVAAAASSILTLLYYLFRAGLLGRGDD